MLTVDQQLDEALAQVARYKADLEASENLLTEARNKIAALEAQCAEIQANYERSEAELQTCRATISDLQSREQDIEARAARRAAEIIAASGMPSPAPVTARGDSQTEDLVAKFRSIKDPKIQTEFWRSLSPNQKASILSTL